MEDNFNVGKLNPFGTWPHSVELTVFVTAPARVQDIFRQLGASDALIGSTSLSKCVSETEQLEVVCPQCTQTQVQLDMNIVISSSSSIRHFFARCWSICSQMIPKMTPSLGMVGPMVLLSQQVPPLYLDQDQAPQPGVVKHTPQHADAGRPETERRSLPT